MHVSCFALILYSDQTAWPSWVQHYVLRLGITFGLCLDIIEIIICHFKDIKKCKCILWDKTNVNKKRKQICHKYVKYVNKCRAIKIYKHNNVLRQACLRILLLSVLNTKFLITVKNTPWGYMHLYRVTKHRLN